MGRRRGGRGDGGVDIDVAVSHPLPHPLSPLPLRHPINHRRLLAFACLISLAIASVISIVVADPLPLSHSCFSSSELAALSVTPTRRTAPDGSPVPPLILDRDGWQGHYISTALAALLLQDAMGYTVQLDDGQTDVLGSVAADGATRVNMELWPESNPRDVFDQLYTQQGKGINAGPLGVIGGSGWYVPTYLLDDPATSDLYVDFWRAYKNKNVLDIFPRAGTVDPALLAGSGREYIPPWCVKSTNPPGCSFSSHSEDFVSGACSVTHSPDCIEMIGIDVYYDEGILQQQIFNNRLNITVPFLSEANFYAEVMRRYGLRQPMLFYYWQPSTFILNAAFTRVSLKAYSTECFRNNTADFDGRGSVDCDFPSQVLLKIMSKRFVSDPMYQDAGVFLQNFQLSTTDQTALLGQIADDINQWDESSFQIACNFLKSHSSQWSPWLRNTPAVLYGRKEVSTGTTTGITVVVALCAVCALLLHVSLFLYRQHPVYVASSVVFCQLIVAGSWFGFASLLIYPHRTATGACLLMPMCFSVCFALMFGSLSAKTLRLYRIFSRRTLTVVRITNGDLARQLVGFIAIDALIFILWGASDPPSAALHKDGTSLTEVYLCDSKYFTAWYLLLLLPKALVVAGCVFCAYRVRHVSSNLNETRYIAIAVYNLAVMSALIFPLLELLAAEVESRYIVMTLGLLSAVMVTLGALFVPKMFAIHLKTGSTDSNHSAAFQPNRTGLGADSQLATVTSPTAAQAWVANKYTTSSTTNIAVGANTAKTVAGSSSQPTTGTSAHPSLMPLSEAAEQQPTGLQTVADGVSSAAPASADRRACAPPLPGQTSAESQV